MGSKYKKLSQTKKPKLFIQGDRDTIALYENFEEVENFTRFQKWGGVFSYGENKFREEEIYLADTSFFEVFSFELLEGDLG